MFFGRKNFNAGILLEFQIVTIFLISESFESPPQRPKNEIFLADKDVPPEFPKYSNKAEFQGAPILDMKNFENNTFEDVINVIKQITRQKSNLANKPTHVESASKDTHSNGTGTTINYIQNITIYQNPTENTKWILLAAIVILLGGLLAFNSREKLYKNQYSSIEHLIRCNEYKESNNVIGSK